MASGLLQPRPRACAIRSRWHAGRSSSDRPSTFPPGTGARGPSARSSSSSRAVRSELQPATGTGRGRPAGRGGAVTRPRARADGRASERSAAPEVRRPRAARLRSARAVPGVERGAAARDPADRTTSPSSLPAGPRFPEGTRSQEERSQFSQAGSKTMECVVPLTEHSPMNCTRHSSETSS